MSKQGYISISDLAWDAMGNPDFEHLKQSTVGLPSGAKCKTVIYVFEDESLPDIPESELFKGPSFTVMCK